MQIILSLLGFHPNVYFWRHEQKSFFLSVFNLAKEKIKYIIVHLSAKKETPQTTVSFLYKIPSQLLCNNRKLDINIL